MTQSRPMRRGGCRHGPLARRHPLRYSVWAPRCRSGNRPPRRAAPVISRPCRHDRAPAGAAGMERVLQSSHDAAEDHRRMKPKKYEKELRKLQVRLCHLQEWIKEKGLRVVIVFEGR